MMDRFVGKTVLVTGAGTGIGRHVAMAFRRRRRRRGGRRPLYGAARRTAKLIEADGGRATPFTADVTSSADVACASTGPIPGASR
jgi:NAD(P)-dependent dehydrogenase (short-subunit alcohol dehydrogenase family)